MTQKEAINEMIRFVHLKTTLEPSFVQVILDTTEWIPCAVRQPKRPGMYLVTKRQSSGEPQLTIGSYSAEFGWSGNGNFKDVVAWMQLPEIYEIQDPERMAQ